MSQFNNNNNNVGSQPQNSDFQEFVKGVRGRYGSGNYATIGDIREGINELEDIENQTTDRVVSAINSNKASDAVIGENRRIYGINTRILKDTSAAPKLLGEIAANTGERQFSFMQQYLTAPLSNVASVMSFGLFRNDLSASKRAQKASKIEDAARNENRKLDLLNYRTNLVISDKLTDLKNVFIGDKNKQAEAENEQRAWWKTLFEKQPDEVDEKKLLGMKTLSKPVALLLALVGSLVLRFSNILSAVNKIADGLIFVAEGALGASIRRLIGREKRKFIKSLNIAKIYDSFFDTIQTFLKTNKIAKIINKAFDMTEFVGDIKLLLDAPINAFKRIKQLKVVQFFIKHKKTIFGGIKKVLGIFKPFAKVAASIGSRLLKFVPGLNIILAVVDVVVGMFKGWKMAEGEGLSKISGMFLGLIGGVLEFFTLGFLDFESFFKNAAPYWSGLLESIMEFDVGGIIKNLFGLAKEAIVGVVKGVKDLFVAVGKGIYEGIKWFLVKLGILEPGKEEPGSGEGAPSFLDHALFKTSKVLGFIGDAVSGFFEKIKEAIGFVFDPIIHTFKVLKNLTPKKIFDAIVGNTDWASVFHLPTLHETKKAKYDRDEFRLQGGMLISRRIDDQTRTATQLADLRTYRDALQDEKMYNVGITPQVNNVTNVYPTNNSSTVVSNNQMVNSDKDIFYTSLRGM